MKRALITGVTGQDGAYLTEFLHDQNYEVHGLYRRSSLEIGERTYSLRDKLNLVEGDVTDSTSLQRTIDEIKPDEIYNLAAQSFVPSSWQQPVSTHEINAIGPLNILEAIRLNDPSIRFYQASTSEMFGKVMETPQSEKTPFYPRSPYGVSKVSAFWSTVNHRESYDLHASNGILFNHESPKRGKQFVTRKISHSVAKIRNGLQDCLELGNLSAKRDWGFAGDYVEAMWLMLQMDSSDDYVVSTGETRSVREFVDAAFDEVGMPVVWEGEGLNEVGLYDGKEVVRVNPKFYRPAEVDVLCGDPTKAKEVLGWKPKVSFSGLARMMVNADLARLESGEDNLLRQDSF